MLRRPMAALLAALAALLTGCGPQTAPAVNDFQRLTLSISGSMANVREYEVLAEAGSAVLSCYNGWWDWEDPGDRENYLETRTEDSPDLYQSVLTLLDDCGVAGWDGFSESDPNVLDGEMFSLELVLADGSVLTAHGSNAWPDGYNTFYQGLLALLDRGS